MGKNLSKSRYTLFRQCPKALWFQVYHPELAEIDAALQARFEAGNEVGDLAMGYLGEYTEVTTYTAEGKLDLKAMIEKTQVCISNGVENIAEASFSWNGNYCAVDILHKTDGGYSIYEVKSSSGNYTMNEKDEVYVKYARDIAYQKYVLTKCGIKVTGTFLVRINNEYVLDGNLNIHDFFYTADLKELVAEEYQIIESNINDALKVLEKSEEPTIDLGCHCNEPYGCSFWNYCSRKLPQPSVFNLYRLAFRKKIDLYHEGVISFQDVRGRELSSIQQLQVESALSGKGYINPSGIRDFLKKLSYPLYFLDFETQQPVIPIYQGTKPYQQIPFQYSLHYIEKEGGELKHEEFLGISGEDPRRSIAESLCRDIPMDVCTTAYNKMFECGRLRELAASFPDLAEHLNNIADHIVDLIEPFRAGDYYLPAMDGSFSIKKVLPALFPDDPQLDYHNLQGGVQNGGEAMSIYPRIKDMTPEEQQKARRALLDYCCLDTLAMVKLWEKLLEVSR